MRRVAAVVLVLLMLGPVIAMSQYDACERCSWEVQNHEPVFICRQSYNSRVTSCEEFATGCRFYACCGRTYCGSFWV